MHLRSSTRLRPWSREPRLGTCLGGFRGPAKLTTSACLAGPGWGNSLGSAARWLKHTHGDTMGQHWHDCMIPMIIACIAFMHSYQSMRSWYDPVHMHHSSMVCAEMLAHGAFRCSTCYAKHAIIPQAELGKQKRCRLVLSLPHCPPLPQPPTSQPNLPHNTDETRPLQHVVPASPGLTS